MTQQQVQRRLALCAAAAVAAGTVTLALGAVSEAAPVTPGPAGGASPFAVAGRGASVGFTEYEAENAATNGTVIGPGPHGWHARRRGVRPQGGHARRPGQVRRVHPHRAGERRSTSGASLPDSAGGTGTSGTLVGVRQRHQGEDARPDVEVRLVLRLLPVHQQPRRRPRAPLLRRDPRPARHHRTGRREGPASRSTVATPPRPLWTSPTSRTSPRRRRGRRTPCR